MRIINNFSQKACTSFLQYRPKVVRKATWSQNKNQCAPIFKMKTALWEDHCRLQDFMFAHFFREDPLRIGSMPPIVEPADVRFHLDKIHNQTAIMAVRPDFNDFIVGAVIAGCKMRWQLEKMADNYDDNSKWRRILKMWAAAENESDIFRRMGVSHILHVYLLAVHKNYRGYGIGQRLLRELAEVGKKKHMEALTVDATSNHAACACQKMGMRLCSTIAYNEYKDNMGYKIFTPPRPHDALRTYALRLK